MDSDVTQVVGVFRNGRVEIDGSVDWPDGSVVVIRLSPTATKWNSDDRPRTPEGIEEQLRRMDEIPPISDEVAEDLRRSLEDMREFSRVCDADCPRRKYPIVPQPGPGAATKPDQP